MSSHALSENEWAELKARWFVLFDLPADQRDALLDDPTISARVRIELSRMLRAEALPSTALDQAAHVPLGLARDVSESASASDDRATNRLIGKRVGPFVITRLIARGGMGAVYEAERADAAYHQRVAIKTVWRGADSDVLLQRFRSERQILAALQHPNISQLVDGGTTDDGTPWLAMEYVEGEPIDAWCDRRQLSLPARLDLFRQVCAAVHHAHQRLVVHRDLKPGNVFVNADGTVKLLDFGIAKPVEPAPALMESTLTEAGLSPLTAAYAAPEQVRGDGISTATDVFALGALLCTLLAGAPPHDLAALDHVTRLVRVRDDEPRLPSAVASVQNDHVANVRGFASAARLADALHGELDAIAQMALRRDPAKRYPSAEALSDDVHRYLRRDRVLARPDTTAYRLWTFIRRHRGLSASTAVVVVTILIAAAITFKQAARIRLEAQRAERAAAFLSGIVSGTNATSSDPLVRLPPRATLAQLLDSALQRVPRAFSDDDGIRARLYTAIGANLSSQGYLSRARIVLDSARLLGERSEGRISDVTARANLEYATLVMDTDGPWAVDAPLQIVDDWVAQHRDETDLEVRLVLVRAMQAHALGEMHRADSLAAEVLRREANKAVRSRTSLRAESIRLMTSSWITRDPRDYLVRARQVTALADSLGLVSSNEQIRAMAAEIEALLVLGRSALATERANRWQAMVDERVMASDGVIATTAQLRSFIAAVQGDTATRHRFVHDAWELSRHSRDLSTATRLLVSNATIDDALARGDPHFGRLAAESSLTSLQPTRSPLVLSFAFLYAGVARLADGDARQAERALRDGLAQVRIAPDLASMGTRLRRPLADALRRQGRTAEADSVARLDPPRAAVPKCTPGGEWRGCPDVR